MLILALDSTAQRGTVALFADTELVATETLNTGNTHGETLLPVIEHLLGITGHCVGDIGLFACTTGPGSFTGVRIGVATVKGLSFGRSIPCVGLSTMEALAYNLMGLEGVYCPVMNARRGQVYTALFSGEDGKLTRLCPDRILPIEELDAELSSLCPKDAPVWLTGDGYALVKNAFRLTGTESTPPILREIHAESVALAGYAAYLRGDFVDDIALSPVYLRPSQAERTRAEREEKIKNTENM